MSQPQDHKLPKEVGVFPVEGYLGAGGMGEVYKVRDIEFDRELALKVSTRAGDANDPSLVRFVGEGKLIGQLQHPAITPVYHLSQDQQGRWYYTMKRVRGRTLASILKAIESDEQDFRVQWTLRKLLSTFVTVCQAVGYAHSRGVIHRDLKPENIMLGDYGEVYVMDWGLAKTLRRNLNQAEGTRQEPGVSENAGGVTSEPTIDIPSETVAAAMAQRAVNDQPRSDSTLIVTSYPPLDKNEPSTKEKGPVSTATNWGMRSEAEPPIQRFTPELTGPGNQGTDGVLSMDGQIMGTLGYMAPEQARGEVDKHDQRTDVFALGAILWEILTGKMLREGMSRNQALLAAAKGTRPDFKQVLRGRRVEPDLQEACWKALEPQPEGRFATVLELAHAVQKWLEGQRAWKLVYEIDFSNEPDSDTPPKGWKIHRGSWGIRSGTLATLNPDTGGVIHLERAAPGGVRVELEGYVEPGKEGELSIFLAAPEIPQREHGDDGYLIQYGRWGNTVIRIERDGFPLQRLSGNVVSGRLEKISAEIVEGVISLRSNGEEVARHRDLFPLNGTRIGLYGWSNGAHICKLRLFSAGVPKERPALSLPDGLAARKYWADAYEEYLRVEESHPGSWESDEACFKAGMCLLELKRMDEAERCFRRLRDTPAAALYAIGLSISAEQQGLPVEPEAQIISEALSKLNHGTREGAYDLIQRAQIRAADLQVRGEFAGSGVILEALGKSPFVPNATRSWAKWESALRLDRPGSFERAREGYLATLESGDTRTRTVALWNLFYIYYKLAQKDRAVEELSRLKSKCADCFPSMVECCLWMLAKFPNEADLALRLFHEASASEAGQDSFWRLRLPVALSKVLLSSGRLEDARARLCQCVATVENTSEWREACGLLCECYRRLRLVEKAYETLQTGRRLQPESWYWDWQTARLSIFENRSQEALGILLPLLAKIPARQEGRLEVLLEIGGIFRATGALARWTSLCRQELELEPLGQTGMRARLWLAVLEPEHSKPNESRMSELHQALNHVQDNWEGYTSCYFIAQALAADFGEWQLDEYGLKLDPQLALLRSDPQFRWDFRAMFDLRSSMDPAWKQWARNPSALEKR